MRMINLDPQHVAMHALLLLLLLYEIYALVHVACLVRRCPLGSTCRICDETAVYCEHSCAVDNGGCDEGNRCVQQNVPTCNPDRCCSSVNITCQGKSRCDCRIVNSIGMRMIVVVFNIISHEVSRERYCTWRSEQLNLRRIGANYPL